MSAYTCTVGEHDTDLDSLGTGVHQLYDLLYQQQNTLDAKWQEFRKLFAHSEERVELLNRTAGFFFYVVENVLWHDVLLHTARILDDPGSGSKTTLTLRLLPSAVSDPALTARLESLVEVAVAKSEAVRLLRNKKLAHTDLALALETATPLPEMTVNMIEEFLSAMHAVLKELDPTVVWGKPLVTDDAESLVRYLELGLKCAEKRRHAP